MHIRQTEKYAAGVERQPWNASPTLCQMSYAIMSVSRASDISERNLVPSISIQS